VSVFVLVLFMFCFSFSFVHDIRLTKLPGYIMSILWEDCNRNRKGIWRTVAGGWGSHLLAVPAMLSAVCLHAT